MPKVIRTGLFQKWFNNLKDKSLQKRITDKFQRAEQDGYIVSKPIAGFKNISEVRIKTGAGYRIYFNLYIKNDEMWLLNGGDKSTQKRDIEDAYDLLQQILEEREEAKK
jgi:putative addiction module killer protein